ncbi:dihydropteroate synthase [Jannaschia sp. W003]|uniref:dihydropteroate synthase n=1 Tax=Jannaschia sp. W003 TaxID=2867012 RepID=UPI0021A6085D|nr:dihydropteroate synthase [Jannaschia sp. W003]UWQ21090.1 dihydropteroate synthase [Jannaschia sp. W003]
MTHALPIPGPEGLPLAGGPVRFAKARLLRRGRPPETVSAESLPDALLARLTAPRPPFAGLPHDRTRIMGILNVTPDSFSDGGRHFAPEAAARAAAAMEAADLVDVGAESTRPGAAPVEADEEWRRLAPVLEMLGGRRVSVDTRRAETARRAIGAGAAVVNDVSGGTFDPHMLRTVADSDAALCLMHGPFDPAVMQDAPRYDDVVLDVYDFLEARLGAARAAGIPDGRLMADPGIGFGKTEPHNLALLRALPLFHGLGVPILLGVSRKGFIGRVGAAPQSDRRMPGTLALTLDAVRKGVQWHRIHDVPEIAQGLALWRAVQEED